MSEATKRVDDDGTAADVSDNRPQRQDHISDMPHLRLVGEQIGIEAGGKRRLMRRFGVNSNQLEALLVRLARATAREGQTSESEFNLMVGLIWEQKPETQMELHLLSLEAIASVMAARGAHYIAVSATVPQQDSGERLFSRSNRTYAMLMDVYYRTRLQRHHLAQLEGPREERPEPLAITHQQAVPMPPVQPADAAAVSTSSESESEWQ